jgi:hypothetical protein
MKGLMWKNLTTLLVSLRYEKARCFVVDAIKNGRTNPGPKQSNEGWPNTFHPRILARFPHLGK